MSDLQPYDPGFVDVDRFPVPMPDSSKRSRTWTIGIDPGKTGALALLNPLVKLVVVRDMPTSGDKEDVAEVLVAEVLREWARRIAMSNDGIHVALEQVATLSPGRVANFKLGRAYGIVLGAVAMAELPLTLYRPTVWKGQLGLSSDKELSRQRAIRTWPEHADTTFRLKKHEGRAEAALIAWYHWKLDRGEVPE
jgi:Holliday junction resolvasome RuvABC endonuclease subunit